MELESVTFLDCLPARTVRPDIPSRTELNAARDQVKLALRDGFVLIDFRIGVPLSRVVRFRLASQ